VSLTRIRDLLATAVIAALLVNLVVRFTYGSLPPLPLTAGVPLGVLGLAEAVAGKALRDRIRRRPGSRPVQPLVAARAVLVAKASAVAGAIMAGVWAGVLAYSLPRSGLVAAAAADSAAAGVGLLSALVLVGGALWLERSCRTPDEDRPEPPDPGRAARG
jgi:hypothetical protein